MPPLVWTRPAPLLILALGGCYSPSVPVNESRTDTDGVSTSAATTGQASSEGTTSTSETTTSDGDESTTSTVVDPGETSSTTESHDESSTTSSRAVCGDRNLDPGEECDDGNVEDNDACSATCEQQFFAGNSSRCDVQQSEVCNFLNGSCYRTQSPAAGGAVCYWDDFSASSTSCDEAPGIWTPPDAPFAEEEGVNIPEPGACLTFVGNLACTAGDQTTCDAAGASVCFQNKAADGTGNLGVALCAWDVSQPDCDETPGLWTSSGSTFEENHPNSVPPGDDGACITQVSNL